MNYLLLTVRFLDDRYHGLLDRGGKSCIESTQHPVTITRHLTLASLDFEGTREMPCGQGIDKGDSGKMG